MAGDKADTSTFGMDDDRIEQTKPLQTLGERCDLTVVERSAPFGDEDFVNLDALDPDCGLTLGHRPLHKDGAKYTSQHIHVNIKMHAYIDQIGGVNVEPSLAPWRHSQQPRRESVRRRCLREDRRGRSPHDEVFL